MSSPKPPPALPDVRSPLLTRVRLFMHDLGWSLRVLWRYWRPKLRSLPRPSWQNRRLKTDPAFRLLALQVLAGAGLLAMALVAWSIGSASGEKTPIHDLAALELPPPPSLQEMAAENEPMPEPVASTPANLPPTERQESPPQPLSPDNFRFELFSRREADGRVRTYAPTAERTIREWFPVGGDGQAFMRFVGGVLARSDDEANFAKNCLRMPRNKVFTEAGTITCTYGHRLPAPLRSSDEEQQRVFWIMAMTHDAAGKVRDIEVHARLTTASR